MNNVLRWHDLHLGEVTISASNVRQGEYIRLVLDAPHQLACLHHIFTAGEHREGAAWNMWVDTEAGQFDVDHPAFTQHVVGMIRQHGLIANLTLQENLLLPFLYRGDKPAIQQASAELDDVAERLGIAASLHERAGERNAYSHALISLGRCLLSRPSIVVAQEVHLGMTPEHLQHFKTLATQALEQLDCGLLYLSATENEGSGLDFARTLTLSETTALQTL